MRITGFKRVTNQHTYGEEIELKIVMSPWSDKDLEEREDQANSYLLGDEFLHELRKWHAAEKKHNDK